MAMVPAAIKLIARANQDKVVGLSRHLTRAACRGSAIRRAAILRNSARFIKICSYAYLAAKQDVIVIHNLSGNVQPAIFLSFN